MSLYEVIDMNDLFISLANQIINNCVIDLVDQTSKKGCTLLIYSHNNTYFILEKYILLMYTD